MKRNLALMAAVLGLIFATVYFPFTHYQRAHHVAIVWNKLSGEFWLESRSGLHFSPPWVFAAKIDVRPMRVSVTSASRSFNAKLVQFNPAAYREFIAVEGTRYYWWDNRISFNGGYAEEFRGMRDILRGYAYSLKQYPFITTVREFGESE